MKNAINNSTDISNLNISIDGVTYTAERNSRYSWAEFWTIIRDGKKFATVRWCDDNGWIGTFQTKGLRSGLWMMSNGSKLTIEDRIARLDETNKEFNKRLIIC